MKKQIMILGGLGLAAAAALIFFMFSKEAAVAGFQLVEQPYVQTIQGTGRIQADRKIDISAQAGEMLEQINVKEGQSVEAGDILAVFDDRRQILSLQESRILLQAAQNRLASIKGPGLEAAESLLRQHLLKQEEHQRLMVRSQMLFEASALSAAEMESIQLQAQLMEEEVLAAQRAITAKQPGGHEYQDALLSVEQAKAQLEQRQTDRQYYEIQAPFHGVILKIQGVEGKHCSIGDALLTMADPATYGIRMDVDERYLDLLKQGQTVYFWLGEDSSQRYPGTVETVSRQVDSQTGTIEVKIQMDSDMPWLAEDLTLQAEIAVREASQGLLVPQAYIYKEDPFQVLALQEGKVQPVTFQGVRIDQRQILVVEGLAEGSILLDPAQNLMTGQEISRVQIEGGADHAF